jgi:hypothetical protein
MLLQIFFSDSTSLIRNAESGECASAFEIEGLGVKRRFHHQTDVAKMRFNWQIGRSASTTLYRLSAP